MDPNLFAAIDLYLDALFVPSDPALEAALQSGVEAGLPQIQVSPSQGKLLYLLARLARARRVLEIGTLAGYSTIWLARALPPDGRLVTLEANPKHADIARANLARSGLADRVELVVGAALDTLPGVAAGGEGPFDLVFLDADKTGYVRYLEWALRLTRSGSLIVADNVVRGGRVLAPGSGDASAQGAHAFNAALAAEPRVEAVVLQTVGAKGHDGLAVALVK